MKLGRISATAWFLAVAFGLVALALRFGVVRVTGLGIDSFWFMTAAFAILALAPVVKPR
jgi:hypothetical protein